MLKVIASCNEGTFFLTALFKNELKKIGLLDVQDPYINTSTLLTYEKDTIDFNTRIPNLVMKSILSNLDNIILSDEIPNEFRCPISREVLTVPFTTDNGMTYDESSLHEWVAHNGRLDPLTGVRFTSLDRIYHNKSLFQFIDLWRRCKTNFLFFEAHKAFQNQQLGKIKRLIIKCKEINEEILIGPLIEHVPKDLAAWLDFVETFREG